MIATAPLIAVPKHVRLGQGFSKRDIVNSYEAPGRPWHRLAGGWISDSCALKKFIILCPFCVHKFNPRRHHYEVWRAEILSIGRCDDCKQVSRHLRGFIHESTHDVVGEERPRRRGRWAKG